MTFRVCRGDLDGAGTMGLRVSRPGYDVLSEPLGSNKIAFDSRLAELGMVWLSGSTPIDHPVLFPAAPAYPPLLVFYPISGNDLFEGDYFYVNNAAGTVANYCYPYVGILSSDRFVITRFTNPFYGTGGIPSVNFAFALFTGTP